jgi:LL-diaminopimelate aminotransferase
MTTKASERLGLLPPYLFAAIDAAKKAAIDKGADIISLGVGDPDLPTPPHVIAAGTSRHGQTGQPPISVWRRAYGRSARRWSRWYKSRFQRGVGSRRLKFIR